ncbi:MAG: hypothetical protein NTY64_06440 [Deltaproteobacteria bacterium]|nr:hypothetical protein [Deltaproteobacteria bacterium]
MISRLPRGRISYKFDGFLKSPSAALRFPCVAVAYHPSTRDPGGFARRVPRNAGELLPKPSLWRLFTRSSLIHPGHCFFLVRGPCARSARSEP